MQVASQDVENASEVQNAEGKVQNKLVSELHFAPCNCALCSSHSALRTLHLHFALCTCRRTATRSVYSAVNVHLIDGA